MKDKNSQTPDYFDNQVYGHLLYVHYDFLFLYMHAYVFLLSYPLLSYFFLNNNMNFACNIFGFIKQNHGCFNHVSPHFWSLHHFFFASKFWREGHQFCGGTSVGLESIRFLCCFRFASELVLGQTERVFGGLCKGPKPLHFPISFVCERRKRKFLQEFPTTRAFNLLLWYPFARSSSR